MRRGTHIATHSGYVVYTYGHCVAPRANRVATDICDRAQLPENHVFVYVCRLVREREKVIRCRTIELEVHVTRLDFIQGLLTVGMESCGRCLRHFGRKNINIVLWKRNIIIPREIGDETGVLCICWCLKNLFYPTFPTKKQIIRPITRRWDPIVCTM